MIRAYTLNEFLQMEPEDQFSFEKIEKIEEIKPDFINIQSLDQVFLAI